MPTVSNGSGGLRTALVQASSAQVLALGTTPVELVPAQGAGTVIVPVALAVKRTFVTTAYTSAGGVVDVGIASGGDNTNNLLFQLLNAFMTGGTSLVGMFPLQIGNEFTASTFENVRLAATQGGTAFTLGDGTLTFSVAYYVAPL